jgi:putative endonuclease
MPDHRRTLGAQGEALAAAHLAREGYRIVGRNVRAQGVELDLVAARGSLRVFVEVKTRHSRRLGLPEEAVDRRKRERLVRGAAAWMREHRVRAGTVRFDVIAVERSADGRWELRHLPGAFDASHGW